MCVIRPRVRHVVFVVYLCVIVFFFFFQAEDGIRDTSVTGVQTCALPISQRVERALAMLRDALVAVRARAGNAASADVLRGITTTQLHALIAVVEEGAFARAARRAGRARAAVHRAARQLERSLGTDLFEVTSFGVLPTREAARLALRSGLAFAELGQAQA